MGSFVVIFIVCLIIFLLFSLRKRYRFSGGQYVKARRSKDDEIIATPSQLAFENLSNETRQRLAYAIQFPRTEGEEMYAEMLKESFECMKRLGGFKWNGITYRYVVGEKSDRTTFSIAERVSDAYIDMLSILLSTRINRAVSACEFNYWSCTAEPNEVYSLFANDGTGLPRRSKAETYGGQRLYNEFSDFFIPVLDVQTIKNNLGTAPRTSVDAFSTALREGVTDPLLCEVIDTLISEYTDNEMTELLKEFKNFIESYKRLNTNASVFIEFSYPDKQDAESMYCNIHRETAKILKWIYKTPIRAQTHSVFIIRILVNDEGIITPFNEGEVRDETLMNLRFFIFDKVPLSTKKGAFQTIRIPATTMLHGFSCDEGMLVETVTRKKYDIQIEHSEGDGQHKSNIIEFIGRTVMRYGTPTLAELKALISSLGYQYYARTELFKTYLEPSAVPIDGRIVYACFLNFADRLFKR